MIDTLRTRLRRALNTGKASTRAARSAVTALRLLRSQSRVQVVSAKDGSVLAEGTVSALWHHVPVMVRADDGTWTRHGVNQLRPTT